MIEEKDPIALSLLNRYNNIAMPNMRLGREDVSHLVRFLKTETQRVESASQIQGGITVQKPWIRAAHPDAKVNAGYFSIKNDTKNDVALPQIAARKGRRSQTAW